MLNGKLKQFLSLPGWMRFNRSDIDEAVKKALDEAEATREKEEAALEWWQRKEFKTRNPETGQYQNPFDIVAPKFNFFDGEGNDLSGAEVMGAAMDNLTKEVFTNDYDPNNGKQFGIRGILPNEIICYYAAQAFIGWQNCSIIAQHWLVAKACGMKGKDAVRNGYRITCDGKDTLTNEDIEQIEKWDKAFNIKGNLTEADNFKNVFGIRHVLFKVESDDADYYKKPFNPDGITPGSYQGMSQIDPYWMAPLLSGDNVSDPTNINFYNPEFWTIAGKTYHYTHFVILYGPEVSDVMKPSYQYGGLPLTQRIMERVYAAEKTANEIPILVMSKRLSVRKMDMQAAVADQTNFQKAMAKFAEIRDNFGVFAMGDQEEFQQFETSLADLDECVMTQYQLVAAISDMPAVKLLETTPKGFNATGEFENESYHETLETIQETDLTPIVDRHHLCLARSLIIPKLKKPKDLKFSHEWNPCTVESPETRSKINLNDSQAAKNYNEVGAIDADMAYQKITKDPNSGYESVDGGEEAPGIELPEAK